MTASITGSTSVDLVSPTCYLRCVTPGGFVVTIDAGLAARIDAIAGRDGRTPEQVAVDALVRFVEEEQG